MKLTASPVTIVSCWYRIRDRENHQLKNDETNKHFCHPEYYQKAMKGLLEQRLPLVLFTEHSCEELLWKLRPKELHEQTRIIVQNYEELSYWSDFEKWTENHQNQPIINHDSRKFTPLYKFLVSHKADFVKQAIVWNPFHTDLFAWMDLRLHPVYDIPISELEHVFATVEENRVFIHQMAYTHTNDVQNRREFYRATRGNISGGFWVGHAKPMRQFCEWVAEEFKTCITEGFAPSDEMIHAMVVGKHSDHFTPYFGDYGEMLYNAIYVRRNEHLALHFLERSFKMETHYLTWKCADALRKGVLGDCLTLKDQQLFDIWYKGYVALYWLNKRDIGAEWINELFDMCESHKGLNEICKNMYNFLKQNLQYLHDEKIMKRLATFI